MRLYKIRDFLALAKYRFDIGISFMIFINFSLLIITASTKIHEVSGISTIKLYLTLVPAAFISTCLFGFLLDKVFKYQTAYVKYSHSRSPQLMETLNIVRDIKLKLQEVKK